VKVVDINKVISARTQTVDIKGEEPGKGNAGAVEGGGKSIENLNPADPNFEWTKEITE
jgi:hypothetical protein